MAVTKLAAQYTVHQREKTQGSCTLHSQNTV